jgi:hypothetical protein
MAANVSNIQYNVHISELQFGAEDTVEVSCHKESIVNRVKASPHPFNTKETRPAAVLGP